MGWNALRLNRRSLVSHAAATEVEVVITLRVMDHRHAERDDYRIRNGSSHV